MLHLEIRFEKPVLFGGPVEGDFRRVPTDPGDILMGARKRIVAESQRLQKKVEPPISGSSLLNSVPLTQTSSTVMRFRVGSSPSCQSRWL